MQTAAEIRVVRASARFPAEKGERFVVRGFGGERSEVWEALAVSRFPDETVIRYAVREIASGGAL